MADGDGVVPQVIIIFSPSMPVSSAMIAKVGVARKA
jgi:hypothetical protein